MSIRKCRDKQCGAGLSHCCLDCEILNLCPDKCAGASYDCEYAEMTSTERRKVYREKKHTRMFLTTYIILLAVIVGIGLLVIGNQNMILKTQTDVLDRINVLEIDFLDQRQKNDVSEDFRPSEDISTIPLNPDEWDLVCRVVMSEARGEDLQTQMAVCQTIRDRSNAWGMTVTEVVTAPGQYAKAFNGEISDSVKLAVANIFNGMNVYDEYTTHFYDDSISAPYWTEKKVNRGSIGRHTFWY